MQTTKKLLGQRIRELRKRKGLSQDQLSEKIGIDPKHLSRIELGKSFPYMETLEATAKALQVEIQDLFEFHHLSKEAATIEEINKMLHGANEETIRNVYKYIRYVCS
ncbi:MAG: helix-turn-helix transcriptional regulator [Deltaproteobacteria bacterium]|nr:helix-turn-helix transcriptional regulator [Deltaproteobacteria bacterium]